MSKLNKKLERKIDQAATKLETEEALRLIATTQLRIDVIAAARKLLPIATAEAAPGDACKHCGRAAMRGSPALLRLISRLAMREFRSPFFGWANPNPKHPAQ